jgi:hypothetical protein
MIKNAEDKKCYKKTNKIVKERVKEEKNKI